ncbi:uroporphyrinogen-III synthase [Thermotomaculum hydrothermale]|uniref:Uroporphyrinogen-III synthase n=1 Tax=Thermotomaculum hydrothermale TaxID=981385 RepID=A0A7R6SY80_9BACT|nr:uroporphyrinogen-III synthase [Thermotomaculum hydrothermale]BBB32281.1 uroporphyrinogen-III synthase [Thermotomaculum hydrothermale]
MKKIAVFGSKDSLEGLKKIEITETDIEIAGFEAIKFKETEFEISDFSNFDWIFFGSKRGVEFFFKKINPENIKGLKIACVGKKTAEKLNKYGIKPDFIPSNYSSKHFFKEFSEKYNKVKGILFPTSDLSENTLENDFKSKGIEFKKITVYKTICGDLSFLPDFDGYIFLSPSSFKCFIEKNPYDFLNKKIVCAIGSVTAEEIKKYGIPCIFPKKFSLKEALKFTISKLGG